MKMDPKNDTTVWILASVYRDLLAKDDNLRVLNYASNFTQSRIDGMIFMQYEYPDDLGSQ
jgi:hypothetical protein